MKNSNVLSTLTSLLFGLLLFAGIQSQAYTRAEFADAYYPLAEQLNKLTTLKGPSCTQNFDRIFGHDNVKISLFYGYGNFEEKTVDLLMSRTMIHALTQKCAPNVAVCEFTVVSKKQNFTKLHKVINDKNVYINIYSTAITENDTDNRSIKNIYWAQEAFSTKVRQQFYSDLVNSDVVFYMGHSRLGTGLGFNSQSWIEQGVNLVFRMPMRPIVHALSLRPSNLKILGLFACSSQDYYRAELEAANPKLSLILTKDEIGVDEAPQAMIGALNALLAQKCDKEFRKSLQTTLEPKHNITEFIRR